MRRGSYGGMSNTFRRPSTWRDERESFEVGSERVDKVCEGGAFNPELGGLTGGKEAMRVC